VSDFYGRRVGDRFVVEEELGGGGMSSVHRGRDTRLNEAVAIKFLREEFVKNPIVRERFRREAMSLAKLRHPGILNVFDFGESEGELYIVVELVHGVTLESALLSGKIDPLRGAGVFDQLLAALEICHAEQIVHRDIKPSNIMLTGDRVTLIDFGLAWIATGTDVKLTETGTVHGTPNYMAPEQCRGLEITPATDVYAVGVVLYEALAGRAPFNGNNAAVLMAQHLFTAPAPIPEVSKGVEAAIFHALQKKPEDRPTARGLRDELAAAFKGTDPQAMAAAAASQRAFVAGLPRTDRALTGRPPSPAAPIVAAAKAVALWMPSDARSAEIRAALGTAAIPCIISASEEPPAGDIVIASARAGFERLTKLGKRAFILVDVSGPDETTQAIRTGASDMLLVGTPEAELIPKIQKLLRRRRK
jgi:serine/threonine-protein kinase